MTTLIQTLNSKLATEIPIVQALGVHVTAYDGQSVTLAAPLDKNINDKSVAFGGSLNAVATLAAWSLVFLKLSEQNALAPIFVQKHETCYLKPVTQDFTAVACLKDPASWQTFVNMLQKKGRARIDVTATISNGMETALTFTGTYVAMQS